MQKLKVLLINIASLAVFPLLSSGRESVSIDFSKPSAGEYKVVGDAGCINTDGGMTRFNSQKGDTSTFRWANLTTGKIMEGDFTVEFSYQIRQMDHFNGLKLTVGSSVKDWSVNVERRQVEDGKHEVSLTYSVTGRDSKSKGESAFKELGRAGILKMERKGDTMSVSYQPDGGAWREVGSPIKVSTSPAGATLGFSSPKMSNSDVVLRKFTVECDSFVPEAFSPVYLPSTVVADATNGQARLVWREGSEVTEDGVVNIGVNGRAIYALQGPLNLKGAQLGWESSGALKVSVTQIGTAETIELGETLVWDRDPAKVPEGVAARSTALSDYVNRYPGPRGWPEHAHITANNLYFVTFQPASTGDVTVAEVRLVGSPLQPIPTFTAVAETTAASSSDDGVTTLSWKVPEACATWFEKKQALKVGEARELAGIPFVVSPTVLNPSCRSVAIDMDVSAGLIHIAHAAGSGYGPTDSHLASYLVVYEDGTTEAIFAVLRWNCGVFASEYLSNGSADYTWWGPPGFVWGAAHYLPHGQSYGWDAVYVVNYVNPHPEKKMTKVIAYLQPGDMHQFALVGLSVTPPEHAVSGLVEPEVAAFAPDEPQRLTVMKWSAVPPAPGDSRDMLAFVKPDARAAVADMTLRSAGSFTCGSLVVAPAADILAPGPMRVTCAGVSSSLLGWLPTLAPTNGAHLTMIAGGGESAAEWERIHRLGYDAVKIHMQWNKEPEKYDWADWKLRFDRIRHAGLKIEIRNQADWLPKWLIAQIKTIGRVDASGATVAGAPNRVSADPADPVFRNAIVDYYREIGRLAAQYPDDILSINANYGLRFGSVGKNHLKVGSVQIEKFQAYMRDHFSLETIEAKTGLNVKDYSALTPQAVLNDKRGFLMREYARHFSSVVSSLQWDVSRAIRENSKAHLTFNHPFHNSVGDACGLSLAEYLKIGHDLGPGGPFHETADRFCISFDKWLSAKSLGLLYGDEGCLAPPTYEHNVLAYQWMLWMQCWDSLYCQWWGGRPGAQNIAWLKPYYHLIGNATYMPDPVSLTLSSEYQHHAAREMLQRGDDFNGFAKRHFGIYNVLLGCNLNADRYMMDAFPELDAKTSPLLIDDSNGYIDDAFADRIEQHIRNGGVFVANPNTDRLRDGAFLKRFGVEHGKGEGVSVLHPRDRYIPGVSVKEVGKGRILMVGEEFWADFDPSAPRDYVAFMRKLFSEQAGFRPLVQSSGWCVFVVPYREADGNVLVLVYNINADSRTVTVKLRGDAVPAKSVTDLGSGRHTGIAREGEDYVVETTVGPLACTVLRFEK